jgi:hypothetical protein
MFSGYDFPPHARAIGRDRCRASITRAVLHWRARTRATRLANRGAAQRELRGIQGRSSLMTAPLVPRVRGFAESRHVRVYARIGSERVFLPYWLPPRKRTERATLPREGPPRVGVPNCTGLVPGNDVSLRHATEKSRVSTAAAACSIASANDARNHVRSSGDRSETRRSPSLRREHDRSLSGRRRR